MTSLYATETHRGLVITWTGTDLTGVLGSSLVVYFFNKQTRRWFQGGGTCSNPVISTVNGRVQSDFNYAPAAGDVAVGNIGEYQIQVKATFGDTTIGYSVPGTVTIQPRLQDL
jgi:hypothetical protein